MISNGYIAETMGSLQSLQLDIILQYVQKRCLLHEAVLMLYGKVYRCLIFSNFTFIIIGRNFTLPSLSHWIWEAACVKTVKLYTRVILFLISIMMLINGKTA